MSQNGFIFPNFRGENEKIIETTSYKISTKTLRVQLAIHRVAIRNLRMAPTAGPIDHHREIHRATTTAEGRHLVHHVLSSQSEPRKIPAYFPLYWLFDDGIHIMVYSPYSWVVFHPHNALNNQRPFFHCSCKSFSKLNLCNLCLP